MKRSMCIAASALTALLIYACNTNPKKEPEAAGVPKQDSAIEEQRVDTLLTGETINFLDRSGYTKYSKTHSSGFDWSRFRLVDVWKDTSQWDIDSHLSKEYFENYGRLLKYSPDSSLFVDLYSYDLIITKNKDGKLIGQGGEPDSQVSLIDPKTKKKKRLLFFGPGGSIDEGGWLDDDNVVLMGVQQSNEGKPIPVVYKYHLPTSTFYLFESPDTAGVSEKMAAWRKENLKGIDLE